ncbi:PREDICTED: zinc finger X-chromosomal protein-like [Ceratosolen solmsi marchali]|uniref:Zinc finger X-chromosomal protein-like n=1 Tax=Ceratosolen solmsi marchali TaxID=326594 RepID=A0AAJ7E2W6_9HYME|nr:PREDICTED: zinc finger X-chromosomal protein-like [Ceratosolen solmsi marchali]
MKIRVDYVPGTAPQQLPSHPKDVHAQSDGRFQCPRCNTSFTRKNNLHNHLKFQCGQQPRFNCPYCEYRTKHSPNVRTHVRRLHPSQQVYVIDVLLHKNLL